MYPLPDDTDRPQEGCSHATMFRRGRKENKAKLEHKLYLARENPEPIFDISNCDLHRVPPGIYSLCRVFLKEHLDMSGNQIASLAGGGSLGELHVLKKLSLNNNAFTSLPDEIKLLTNLKELHIQNNLIKKLPSTLCTLPNLRVLDASQNLLKELPDELGGLHCLEELRLRGNPKLRRLPRTTCQARSLRLIDVDDEVFVYPPTDVLTQGTEATMKFICDDTNYEYVPIEESRTETDESHLGNFEAKIWELEKLKEQKMREFLELERQNELIQQHELGIVHSLGNNRKKLLADLMVQQTNFDRNLDKIHQAKDVDRLKLLEQLKEVEEIADVAIKHLLELNREPVAQLLEQENLEVERIIASANKYNENLCKNDVLMAMRELLEKETERFREFDRFRTETSRSILEHESECNSTLLHLLRQQEHHSRELAFKLQEDGELQKMAVAALLEKSDARSWSLVQQVQLVEVQLAALTTIEMDRRRLELNQQINDLAEKRMNLSVLLMDLLEQQGVRRSQLLCTLHSLEESYDRADDFWLRQYQQLLDRMPEGLSDFQRNINPTLMEALLMAGVLNYLPFLAKWTRCEDKLLEVSDENLQQVGIKVPNDRARILTAFETFKRQQSTLSAVVDQSPSAPSIPTGTPSAPPVQTTLSYRTSECVVCMDSKCEIINVPCGHFCCCTSCSATIGECPMCRSTIKRKIRVDPS